MQSALTVLLLILIILVALSGFYGLGGRNRNAGSLEATPIVLERISELADLTVLVQEVSRVHHSRIKGFIGGVEAVVVVNGRISVSTDLMQARWLDVDQDARTAKLVLPQPASQQAHLDHQLTRVYRVDRKGMWVVIPSGEPTRRVVNQALVEAQACVEATGDDPQLITRARKHIETILGRFLGPTGWQVSIEWSD